jgi:hypothetical protein
MADDQPQTYAEANAEVIAAMVDVEDANASFFAAFKEADTFLRAMSDPRVAHLVSRWDNWNQKRKQRDRLKERFKATFHEAR